jgi:hypothetical protein
MREKEMGLIPIFLTVVTSTRPVEVNIRMLLLSTAHLIACTAFHIIGEMKGKKEG